MKPNGLGLDSGFWILDSGGSATSMRNVQPHEEGTEMRRWQNGDYWEGTLFLRPDCYH